MDIVSLDRAAGIAEHTVSDCLGHRSMVDVDAGDPSLTAALRDFGRSAVTAGDRLRQAGEELADGLRTAARVYRVADEALAKVVAS